MKSSGKNVLIGILELGADSHGGGCKGGRVWVCLRSGKLEMEKIDTQREGQGRRDFGDEE